LLLTIWGIASFLALNSYVNYGANHWVTATCVQKSFEIKKKSHIYSLLGKYSFWWPERCLRGIKLKLKIEGVFFPWPIPNLHMADKSVHFTRFLANLVPKVLNDTCANFPSVWATLHQNPCSLCPYIIKVYIFWPPSDFAPAHK